MGLDRSTEKIVGMVFLALVVLFMILAITTFEGTPTVLLVVSALVFLTIGLFLLMGPSAGGGGSSQQQSVVMGDGRTITQSQGGSVLAACPHCDARVPETSRFCPECGKSLA